MNVRIGRPSTGTSTYACWMTTPRILPDRSRTARSLLGAAPRSSLGRRAHGSALLQVRQHGHGQAPVAVQQDGARDRLRAVALAHVIHRGVERGAAVGAEHQLIVLLVEV